MRVRLSIECWVLDVVGRVLLLRVPPSPGRPAFWQPITGGREEGETPLDACVREVWEETGLTEQQWSSLVQLHDFIPVPVGDDLVIHKTLFRMKLTVAKPSIRLSVSEHEAFQWSSPDAVPELLYWESGRATWDIVCRSLAHPG